jgi:triosephosphate isomerase
LEGSLPRSGKASELVIAYEPVWAIGTGKTATPEDIAEVHGAAREWLGEIMGAAGAEVRILYGGSVKPANAMEILAVADVDGALVGGASLRAEDFWAIADVAG